MSPIYLSMVTFVFMILPGVEAQKKLSVCYGDRCFKLYTSATIASSAQQQCKTQYDSSLAEILDDNLWTNIIEDMLGNENDTNKLKNNIWLGLKVPIMSTALQRANGTTISMPTRIYWTQGTISRDSSYEQCMVATYTHWKWILQRCTSYSYPYLCERTAASCNMTNVTIPNSNFDHCLTNDTIPHGATIDIQCWHGYQLDGPLVINCIDGNWSQIPQCLPGCPPPVPRTNAKPVLSTVKSYYKVNETVTFVCNEDHIIWQNEAKTHFTSTCKRDGDWSEPIQDCIAREKRERKIVLIKETGNGSITLLSPIEKATNNSVHWMKNDAELSLKKKHHFLQDGSLSIYEPNASDQGLYFCVQKDSKSIQISNIFYDLILQEKCQFHEKDFHTKIHHLKEGNSIILGCKRTTDEPQVKWFKNGKAVSTSEDHSVLPSGALLLKNVKLDDIGFYLCETVQEKSRVCKKNVTHRLLISAETHTVCGIEKSKTSNIENVLHQPWVVTLWQDDEVFPFCYGTIIDRQWVITTAFCLSSFRRKKSLGLSIELGQGTNDSIRLSIASIKVHPNYRQRLNAHDIGLAKLQGPPVNFSMNILPLCLTELDLAGKEICQELVSVNGTVSGWGSLEIDNAKDMHLAVERMAVVEKDVCQEVGKFGFASDMFCAKGISPKPLFPGDSGAPFMVLWKRRTYLAGIYSWGERGAGMGKYDYFTNLAEHIDWVKNAVKL